MRNRDMPATPCPADVDHVAMDGARVPLDGLTKREAAAIAAMQGMLGNALVMEKIEEVSEQMALTPAATFAKMATEHADHALSPAIRAAHAIRACDHAVLAIEMTDAARPPPEIHAQTHTNTPSRPK